MSDTKKLPKPVQAKFPAACTICGLRYKAKTWIRLHPEYEWCHVRCARRAFDEPEKTIRQLRADIRRARLIELGVVQAVKDVGPVNAGTGLPEGVVPPEPRSTRRRTEADEAFE